MAKLKSHGEYKILRRLWNKIAYCQDGKILINRGDGWKLFKKLKPGVDWESAFTRMVEMQRQNREANVCLKALTDFLDEICPSYKKRAYLQVALEALRDDPDGLYIELKDITGMDFELDFSDVNKLCTLYINALREQQYRV